MRLFFKVALGIFFVLPISSCRPSAYGAEKLMADEVGVPLPPSRYWNHGVGRKFPSNLWFYRACSHDL
jgi:hypothetical protein